MPLVVTAPDDETITLGEPAVCVYVIAPVALDVTSEFVYVPELVTVEKSPAGVVDKLTEVTVKVNVKAPVSPSGSEVVPDTAYVPTTKVPPVVIKPLEDTNTLDEPKLFVYVTGPPKLPVVERVTV